MDLDLTCRITTADGVLELEDVEGGYELHRDALGAFKVGWRRHTVSNPWVEGSFTVGAVRENVEETLAVWVTAESGCSCTRREHGRAVAAVVLFTRRPRSGGRVLVHLTGTSACRPRRSRSRRGCSPRARRTSAPSRPPGTPSG